MTEYSIIRRPCDWLDEDPPTWDWPTRTGHARRYARKCLGNLLRLLLTP